MAAPGAKPVTARSVIPQLSDPESVENLDFKVFVHKIHRGKLLPSVKAGKPYFMVGSEQQISDYSNLRYPQVVTTEGVTKGLKNSRACHTAALNSSPDLGS